VIVGDEIEEQITAAEERWLELWTRGPTELRLDRIPLQIGDAAADLKLPDHTGTARRLASLWADRPLLLMFWRQYGCGCGVERAARLRNELRDYRLAGAEVAVVGQGEPRRAAAYREQHGLDCVFLCDSEEEGYRAYGLTEFSVPEILFDAPDLWSHGREVGERLVADRRAIGRPMVDNPWRRPGEFVIETSGTILLAYRWQYCEDFPDPRVHLAAIAQALAAIAQAPAPTRSHPS